MSASLSRSIFSTLSYHSRFSYPLTLDELHRFLLINRPVSSNEVKLELNKLVKQKKIIFKNGFYSLIFRHSEAVGRRIPTRSFPLDHARGQDDALRLKRQIASTPKLRLARRAANLIGLLPWIKLICVTGSLAMENSDADDDIDLMIITAKNRLWLARPLVVLLTSIFFKRRRPIIHHPSSIIHHRDEICLNLWLDENCLEMPFHRRNSSTAHELAQMKPLINKNFTYEKILWQNLWAKKFLANVWKGLSLAYAKESPYNKTNSLLNLSNSFLFRLQYAYMKPKITTEEVTLHSAFFHPLQPAKRIIFISGNANRKLQ